MMKQLLIFSGMIALLASCYSATKPAVGTIIDTYAQYSIISYVNNGVELKSKYTDYSFQFGGSGQLVANKAGIITQGNWAAPMDSLIIKSFTTEPLSGLNNRWKMTGVINGIVNAEFANGIDVTKVQWRKN
jgi:hypothetical protein